MQRLLTNKLCHVGLHFSWELHQFGIVQYGDKWMISVRHGTLPKHCAGAMNREATTQLPILRSLVGGV